MKFNIKVLSLLLISFVGFICATTDLSNVTSSISLSSTQQTVVTPTVHKCACGPTEHWFHKSCVKNYNKQFPDAGLLENNDTEGLTENLVKAIEMLASDIDFVAQDGTVIVPVLNAHGKLLLPMFKNLDYKLCKDILRNVDVQTTLTAQELYQQWSAQLKDMKSAQ